MVNSGVIRHRVLGIKNSNKYIILSLIEEIVGYRIVVVIIDYLKGKRQILLTVVAFVLSFHTNLVCIYKLNDKNVY